MKNKFEHLTGRNNDNLNFMVENYLCKTLTMFMYEGLPATLPQIEIEKRLQSNGVAYVHKYKDELIVSDVTLMYDDLDVYGNATKGNIFIPSTHEQIVVDLKNDGVLIENDFLKRGLKPLLEKYCTLINECEKTMNIVNIWKRTEKMFIANNDREKESLEVYLKNLEEGKIKPITTNLMLETMKVNSYTTGENTFKDLINYHQYLKSEMYSEIGLYDNKNMKKERMIVTEIESSFNILYPYVDNMINCRRNAIEQINKMFGTDIEIGFTSAWEMRFNLGNDIKDVDELKDTNPVHTVEPVVPAGDKEGE